MRPSILYFRVTLCVLLLSSANYGADVTWNVDADGNWNVGGNWDSGSPPANGDNVTIDRAGAELTVTYDTGNSRIADLTVNENFSLEGGNLEITGAGIFSGELKLHENATLTASGSSLSANADTIIENASILARTGASLQLPMASTFLMDINGNRRWNADAAGSTIGLSGITNGVLEVGQLAVNASGGGQIDLSGLTTIENEDGARLTFDSKGAGSEIDLSALTTTEATAFNLDDNAALNIGQLSNARNSGFNARGGSTISLPLITSYEHESASVSWEAKGAGSELQLSNLSTMNFEDRGQMTVAADDAGIVNLSGLTSLTNEDGARITFRSKGVGSQLDLSSLPAAQQSTFVAEDGGTMDLGQLSDVLNSGFTATGGSTLNLPNVSSFPHEATGVVWLSDDPGSLLDMSSLSSIVFDGGGRLDVNTTKGGMIDLNGLSSVDNEENVPISFSAKGVGGSIDLSSLTTLQRATFSAADGATVNISQLSDALNGSFNSGADSTLTLPALADYRRTNSGDAWLARGEDSQLVFPALSTMTIENRSALSVTADGGAAVDLSNLSSISNETNGALSFVSRGRNSAFDLSALTTAKSLTLTVQDKATLNADQLSDARNNVFIARNDSILSLPALSDYITDGATSGTWEANGKDAQLQLPNLNSITIENEARLTIEAENAGLTNLSGLTTVINPTNGRVAFTSKGKDSVLDLSALTSGQNLLITTDDKGVVNADQLSDARNSFFVAKADSVLTLPAINTYVTDGAAFGTWEAVGKDAQLQLPNLNTITIENEARLTIEAENAGLTSLGGLTTVTNPTNGRVAFTSKGKDSVLDLPALTTGQAMTITAETRGVVNADQLSNARNSFFIAKTDSVLSLPGISDYVSDGGAFGTWEAVGKDAQLQLPNLNTITIENKANLTIEAESAGITSLSGLSTVVNPTNGRMVFTSKGKDSQLDLSSLTTGQSITFNAETQGLIDVGQLSDAKNSYFNSKTGSSLSVPSLVNYTNDGGAFGNWEANGANSQLSFPALTTITLETQNTNFTLEAEAGGNTSLASLTSLVNEMNGRANLTSKGNNSVLDLPMLTNTQATVFSAETSGAMNLPQLANATNSSFTAKSGSTLAAPSLTSFVVNTGFATWRSEGNNSQLDLSAVMQVTAEGGGLNIDAKTGGQLDLSSLTTITSIGNSQVRVNAANPNTTIDLTSLAQFQGSAIDVKTGATVNLSPVRTTINNTRMSVTADANVTVGTLELMGTSELRIDKLSGDSIINNGGSIKIGDATRINTIVNLTGDYTQDMEATLQMKIEGDQAGVNHDQLMVGGSIDVAGKLDLKKANNYSPTAGDTAVLLSGNSVSGSFATIAGVDIRQTNLGFAIGYSANEITSRVTLKGDADMNGTVAFADFLALSANFGNPGTWADGDFDGSGDIQFPDFLALSSSFGNSDQAMQAVPEPNMGQLFPLFLVCLLIRHGTRFGQSADKPARK